MRYSRWRDIFAVIIAMDLGFLAVAFLLDWLAPCVLSP